MVRCRRAVLACLLAFACACESPGGLIAPLGPGSKLPGGYSVQGSELDEDGTVLVRIRGPAGPVGVRFGRRDAAPAFARTERCSVMYEAGFPAGSPTPEGLALAVGSLVEAAKAHDEACSGIRGPSRVAPAWGTWLATLLALAILGLIVHVSSPHVPERGREAAFWTVAILATAASAALGSLDIAVPFCDGGQVSRIERASNPMWQILTMNVYNHRHAPMTPIILHAALWFGRSEWTLRLPFVVLSAASIPLIAILGRRFGGRLAGAGAALACGLFAPMAASGLEIRSHALFPVVAALSVLAFAWLLEKPGWRQCLVLAGADALALWSHHLCLVVVAPQILGLLPRSSRTWTLRSLSICLAASLLPLVRLASVIVSDVGLRSIAAEHPDVLTGANTIPDVVSGALAMTSAPVSVILVVLAIAGTCMLLRGPVAPGPLVLVIAAWSPLLALIMLAPFVRVSGVYLRLAFPLLSVLASCGAVRLAGVVARVMPPRAIGHVRSVLAYVLVLALASGTGWATWRSADRPGTRARGECPLAAVASRIRQGDIDDVVLVHGYSHFLLGFYLVDEVRGSREVKRAAGEWVYGPYRVRALTDIRDLPAGWCSGAERSLSRMVDRGAVWLLDVRGAEPTWPGLEEAGGCTVALKNAGARLLLCDGG